MSLLSEAKKLIQSLVRNRFFTECPSCGDESRLSEWGLFYMNEFTPEAEAIYKQMLTDVRDRKKKLAAKKKEKPAKSLTGAKAVNIGSIYERLAPSLRAFSFNRSDCRSLFDPIDYVIFEGLSTKGSVSRIIFSDIKTGKAVLTAKQKEIKSLVDRKKVDWDLYTMGGTK